MAKLRSRDLFGSLAAGLSKGVSAYGRGKYVEGQQGLKSAEKKAKEREAEEKALAKRRQEAEDQFAFLDARDDELSQYAAGELKRMDLGRKLDNSEMKRLFEDFDERQAAEAGENEQYLEALTEGATKAGVPPGGLSRLFLEPLMGEAGVGPADLGTQEGRETLGPFTRTMEEQYEGLEGPPDLERVFAGARERAYRKKLAGAQEEQKIKETVSPPEPEQTPEERGVEAGQVAVAKGEYVAAHKLPESPKKLTRSDKADVESRIRNEIWLEADAIWQMIPQEARTKAGVDHIRSPVDIRKITTTSKKGVRGLSFWGDDKTRVEQISRMRSLAQEARHIGGSRFWRAWNALDKDLSDWRDASPDKQRTAIIGWLTRNKR